MATTLKELYSLTPAAITCTLAGLASGTARECTAIDNTTNLFVDAMVYLTITTHTATTGGDNTIYVYAYGSHDATNFESFATGSDAPITTPTNLTMLKACPTKSLSNTSLKYVIGSIAQAFGGTLPPKWGVVVENEAGGSLNAGTLTYTGIYLQSV